MQYVDVGHKKHLEHCSGSRKRKQEATVGHVEIEGLDELEAEEERMYGEAEDAETRPAKVRRLSALTRTNSVLFMHLTYRACVCPDSPVTGALW